MTVHKRFIIPVIEDDDQNQARPPLRSGLHSNSGQAALLREASLLIIDEVWALPAEVLEAVDDVLQDVMGSDEPFGGKVVLAVGDPRQTAPVTKENTEQATLEASFLTSPLFAHFKVHELQQAQRQAGDPALSAWVDRIGDDYSRNSIDPTTFFDNVDSLQLAKDFLFPPDVLSNPRSVISRCFLTPLNINVDEFNDMVLDDLPGEYYVKRSHDSLKDVERTASNAEDIDAALTTIASISHPRVPEHELRLQVGQVCSVLRNINVYAGLVKHARVEILRINSRSITVRLIISGKTFLLPRVNFEFRPQSSPFRIVRKQYPLWPAYASTFHACQGLTLDRSIIDCTTPVFAHGQRYAALSRTRHRTHTRTFIPPGVLIEINNIVFRPFVDMQL
ncbi:unnamed protein product [Tilletia laevis]|nr:unnamed protein product [Tilletia laevis]